MGGLWRARGAAAETRSSSSEELRRGSGRRKRGAEPPAAPDALVSLVREGPAVRTAWGGGDESSSNAKGRDEARMGPGTSAVDVAPDPPTPPDDDPEAVGSFRFDEDGTGTRAGRGRVGGKDPKAE
jgi:hypothetical protein